MRIPLGSQAYDGQCLTHLNKKHKYKFTIFYIFIVAYSTRVHCLHAAIRISKLINNITRLNGQHPRTAWVKQYQNVKQF